MARFFAPRTVKIAGVGDWTNGEKRESVPPPPRFPASPERIKFKGFSGPGVATVPARQMIISAIA